MIVVTGATGNVGRTLVGLVASSGEDVVAVSRRSPEPPLPQGVRHQSADLAEPDGLLPAFDGADALFLLTAGRDPRAVLDAAEAGGVRRVVLLSSQGAGTRPHQYPHPAAFERAVRDRGLPWTVLRPGGFHSNAFAWVRSIREQHTVAAPFGDVALPTVDPVDIAEVAAAALLDHGHEERTYVLTGPEPTTPRERAEAIGDVLGVPLRFVEQTREQARARMTASMPEPVVDATLAILGDPLPEERRVSGDVARLLGRPARSFADWAERNAAIFR
ncbi:NAD(P)H-binding protein [Saccharothrix coeruleofusca]|uniref:NmrA family transcriptional regulator n=1 Tax=Saccharothrix coeruleofusca TaxID=33919 RepID=A0A918EGJ1_9PSEU|nr:NAD(P)H-binding protein [Saccharothrix coeruleofusca]GGP81789.1 NmrA family transcriptional regulator [Saccharothrix coeruleofusca]